MFYAFDCILRSELYDWDYFSKIAHVYFDDLGACVFLIDIDMSTLNFSFEDESLKSR